MYDSKLLEGVTRKFRQHFGGEPAITAYAPGRVEVLGNHTDYNLGYTLSAAINMGTFFLVSPATGPGCRVLACDLNREATFDLSHVKSSREHSWCNYIKGVVAGLQERGTLASGFNALFCGNIPLGAGLSSSAALEMTAGLALSELYGMKVDPLDMAKIGQAAEHHYAGVKCGLLDQISSLFGQEDSLIMIDFRSLTVGNIPFSPDACFLMCNTAVKHSLVDSEYNERRTRCEEATAYFAGVLNHPVHALRDVSWDELQEHAGKMNPVVARRAAHVVGENRRVLAGADLLKAGKLDEFGKLMFESHESSMNNFQNSCPELDFIVETVRPLPGVMGARLSGGGFGGSAVVMVHPRDVENVSRVLTKTYREKFTHTCDVRVIKASAGAQRI